MYKYFRLLLIVFLAVFTNTVMAQVAPDGILFQAVARDANGNAASGRNVYAKISIIKGATNGAIEYLEQFKVVSTDEGIFTVVIGKGTRITGAVGLASINWGGALYFVNIKIAIEPTIPLPGWNADNEYVDMGTSQLWTVPYALFSSRATIADSAISITTILPASKGGTGVDNSGKTITLANSLSVKGIGDLTLTTTGISNITFPTSGTLATKDGIEIFTNKTISSPRLIGNPSASTPIASSTDTSIATTAFVTNRIKLDTASLSARITALGISTNASTNEKLNIADTLSMLSSRFKRDTSSLSNRIDIKLDAAQFPTLIAPYLVSIAGVKYSDTAIMLSNYLGALNNLRNSKLNSFDTASMLSNRFKRDTSSLSNRIDIKLDAAQFPTLIAPYLVSIAGVKYSDTATMLSNYLGALNNLRSTKLNASDTLSLSTWKLNKGDTATMLSNYLGALNNLRSTKLNTSDTLSLATWKLNKGDTATMLSNYSGALNNLRSTKTNFTDTALMLLPYALKTNVTSNVGLKLNISDTSAMLANYLTVLNTLQNNKLNLVDTAFMLAAYRLSMIDKDQYKIDNDLAVADLQTTMALKATLASPSLSGIPTAPTATTGTNTIQLATTAFVNASITNTSTPDATSVVKGKVRLTNDLGGSADFPQVISVGGSSATDISTATILANASTESNTASAIVKRDMSGDFSAGTITANLLGTATNVTGIVLGAKGGTGINNTGKTITLGGNINTANNFTTIGNFPTTLNVTGLSNITLPITGTLSTLSGVESLTNKTINSLIPTSLATGFSIAGGTISKTLTVNNDAILSGTNTGDQFITLTGDVTGLGAGTFTTTLVNTTVTPGTYGTGTSVPTIIVDAKGRITSAINTTISGVSTLGSLLESGKIIIGDVNNLASKVDMAGDISISNVGVTAIGANKVLTTNIANANITYAKIQNVSATNKILGRVSAGAGLVEEISTTGTGDVVRAISPTFTGAPQVTTPIVSSNDNTIANTQYVTRAIGNISASSVSGILPGSNGGTGKDNTGKTITLGGDINTANNFTTIGNFATTLNTTATTNLILPSSGTLATTADLAAVSGGTFSGGQITGIVAPVNGGTGKDNTGKTITLGGDINTANNFTTVGNFPTTLNATAITNVTLPTTGTLATKAGAEAFTNKTINGLTPTAQITGFTIAGGNTTSKILTVSNDATIAGNNTGDITTIGEGYLSLTNQVLTANSINLAGTNVIGTLAAARFPALTGDITNLSGNLATTIATAAVTTVKIADNAISTLKVADNAITSVKILDGAIGSTKIATSAVTLNKIANMAAQTLLGNKLSTAGAPSEILLGTGLSLDASTGILSASGSGGTVSGSGTVGQLPYWSSTSAMASNPNFTWDNSNSIIKLGEGVSHVNVDAYPNPSMSTIPVLSVIGKINDVTEQTLLRLKRVHNHGTAYAGMTDFVSTGGSANYHRLDIRLGNANDYSYNNVMSFVNNGLVGINNVAPTEQLDVSGNIRFSGALMPNNNAGTLGSYLTSAGTGTAPTWSTIGNASTSTSGLLTSANWNTFNNKYNLPSLTNGSVLFSNGTTIAQDNANFYWDNTNKRLGILAPTPTSMFQVGQAEVSSDAFKYNTALSYDYNTSSQSGVLKFAYRGMEYRTKTETSSGVLYGLVSSYYNGTTEVETMRTDNTGLVSIGNLKTTNLKVTAGTVATGNVLTSDASGNASWITPATGIGGSGIANYIPKFNASTTFIGNSNLFDDGTSVHVNATSGAGGNRLAVYSSNRALPVSTGTTQTGGAIRIGNSSNDVMDMGSGVNNGWIQVSDKLNLGQTYSLQLNPNGGNVGIGITTTPTSKLQVNGDIASTSVNSLIVKANGNNIVLGTGNVLVSLSGGTNNVAVGQFTLNNLVTGSENLGMGYSAMFNTRGSYNVGLGHNALWTNNTGNYNTAVGHTAGYASTGSNNTFLGYNANSSGTIANATAIGNGAIVAADNTIQLGNTSITNVNTSGAIISASTGMSSVAGKFVAGTNTPASVSAVMEANSTTQGFLPPRMTMTQRDAINTPVKGLIVMCTDCGLTNGIAGEVQMYNGMSWKNIAGTEASSNNVGVTVPAIGSNYQGGVVAYILAVGDPGYEVGKIKGFIVSAADLSYTGRLDAGTRISGITNTDLGVGGGITNFAKLVTAYGVINSSAVKAVYDYSVIDNGVTYKDWYLPSKGEFDKLFANRVAIGVLNLDGSFYWTSNQCNGGSAAANMYRLSDAYAHCNGTETNYKVRAMRNFTITPETSITATNFNGKASAATYLAGGIAGAVPYQSAIGTTSFTVAGTSGQFLTTTGAGDLIWGIPSTAATSFVGTLPIGNGGTGSSTKSFVDLTTAQTIAGTKIFSDAIYANSVMVGKGRGQGDQNTAVGASALGTGTGLRNTAIGYNAMGNYTGTSFDNNTSVGYQNSVSLSTGQANTSVGAEALMSVSTAVGNTSIGSQSLISTTGSGNTGLGVSSGHTNAGGTFNTFVGYNADIDAATRTNATAIGSGAIVTADNAIQLGNTSVTNVNTSGSITAGLGTSSVLGKLVVGSTTASSSTAVLEASSTTQGFLPPRMTATQRDAITSPVAGLVIWCNNCGLNGQLQVNNGIGWTNMIGGAALEKYVALGDSYKGGKVFYILQSGDPGFDANVQHGLIAANSDQNSGYIIWSTAITQCYAASDVLSNCQVASIYMNADVNSKRLQCTAIGQGLINTNAIVAIHNLASTGLTTYAAGLCDNYSVIENGVTYSDWYLPSKDELYKLWQNKGYVSGLNNSGWYWSSSEGSDNKAYMQNFSTASVIMDDKSHANVQRVHAVRTF